MRPAVFSLVNTVVGGGTLSLAYRWVEWVWGWGVFPASSRHGEGFLTRRHVLTYIHQIPNTPHHRSFHAAGAVLGAVLLALICLGTDMTLFFLISCARRTGARNYEVCAFGFVRLCVCAFVGASVCPGAGGWGWVG